MLTRGRRRSAASISTSGVASGGTGAGFAVARADEADFETLRGARGAAAPLRREEAGFMAEFPEEVEDAEDFGAADATLREEDAFDPRGVEAFAAAVRDFLAAPFEATCGIEAFLFEASLVEAFLLEAFDAPSEVVVRGREAAFLRGAGMRGLSELRGRRTNQGRGTVPASRSSG